MTNHTISARPPSPAGHPARRTGDDDGGRQPAARTSFQGAALLGLLLGLTLGGPAFADPTSTYTKLDLDACETLSFEEEGGSVSLRCPGYQGHPVYYSEGDLRADVDFGAPNDLLETFGAFNTVGDTVEWRLDAAGRPFAAILRTHLDPGDGGRRGQVLGVYKVGESGRPGCTVAYVDALANKDANVLARKAADGTVPAFACGRDRPRYVGAVSPSGRGATAVGE